SNWAPTAGGVFQLADTLLGADTANFDFTSISGSYIALKLTLYLRGDTAAATTNATLRFNNDSGSNYDYQYGLGQAATASAAETFAQTSCSLGSIPANTAGANLFGDIEIWIPHYAGAANNKALISSWASKSGTSTTNLTSGQMAGFYRSNTAITRIT